MDVSRLLMVWLWDLVENETHAQIMVEQVEVDT